MQNNEFDGFGAVWQRVTAPSCPVPAVSQPAPLCDTTLIEGFIRREAALEDGYLALLRRWRGSRCAGVFQRGAKHAANRHSRLQAIYYLATGDSFAPDSSGRINCDLPEALRTMWFLEHSAAAAYLQASAAQTGAEPLSYSAMADSHGRQAAALLTLLESMMR